MERYRQMSSSMPDPFNGTVPTTERGYFLKVAAQTAYLQCRNCSDVLEFFDSLFTFYESWYRFKRELDCPQGLAVTVLLPVIFCVACLTLLFAGLTCGYLNDKAIVIRDEIPERHRDPDLPSYIEVLRTDYARHEHHGRQPPPRR